MTIITCTILQMQKTWTVLENMDFYLGVLWKKIIYLMCLEQVPLPINMILKKDGKIM